MCHSVINTKYKLGRSCGKIFFWKAYFKFTSSKMTLIPSIFRNMNAAIIGEKIILKWTVQCMIKCVDFLSVSFKFTQMYDCAYKRAIHTCSRSIMLLPPHIVFHVLPIVHLIIRGLCTSCVLAKKLINLYSIKNKTLSLCFLYAGCRAPIMLWTSRSTLRYAFAHIHVLRPYYAMIISCKVAE